MDLQGLSLPSAPHVYPLREDSFLLAEAAQVHPGERVLEVGCGLGLASLAAARQHASVLAVDVNPYALRAVCTAARERGLEVSAVRTYLLDGVGQFDAILFNPPYLPTRDADRDPDPWVDCALNGGPDGLAVTRRFLRHVRAHLAPTGRAYLVLSRVKGQKGEPLDALEWCLGGLETSIAARRRVEGEDLVVVELRPGPGARS